VGEGATLVTQSACADSEEELPATCDDDDASVRAALFSYPAYPNANNFLSRHRLESVLFISGIRWRLIKRRQCHHKCQCSTHHAGSKKLLILALFTVQMSKFACAWLTSNYQYIIPNFVQYLVQYLLEHFLLCSVFLAFVQHKLWFLSETISCILYWSGSVFLAFVQQIMISFWDYFVYTVLIWNQAIVAFGCCLALGCMRDGKRICCISRDGPTAHSQVLP